MNILYYDCFSGISGDMNLGAMIDLGVKEDYLKGELSKLNLDSEFELNVYRANRKGIDGTKVDVILKNSHSHEHGTNHDEHHHEIHTHKHDHHEHDHHHKNHHHHHETNIETPHVHKHSHEEHNHDHRNLKDIENIINSSNLEDRVKRLSKDIFMKIAVAEAKVHGKALNEVHFHEVGAIDSIVDIVGAAICIDYLNVDKIISSPIELGGGFVRCDHGLIPVPAPATVEILKGLPVSSGRVKFETTTPTGAAILATLADEFVEKLNLAIEKIGYGVGTRDTEIPNVLRVYLAKDVKAHNDIYDDNYILETNIDDMNPELFGYIEEKLFQAGALDVYRTPIIMKKGRNAIKLSILVKEKDEESVKDIIFRETTSIGLRKYKIEKIMLDRDFQKVTTSYGEITIKNAYYKGERVNYKPEYEDCKSLAAENNVAISKIYKEANRLAEER